MSPQPLTPPTVIRTGHDQSGKAIVSDRPPEQATAQVVSNGDASFYLAYTTQEFPVDMNKDKDVAAYQKYASQPPGLVVSGGTVLRYVDMAPGITSPMHRTVSMDYGIVIAGEMELVLDSGETRLMQPGDVIGWNHWIPERNHATFTGQEEINVRQDGINTNDQHVSPSIKRSVHCDLDHEARDRMIRVVTTVAQSKLAMPSFPSLQLLEDLIDIFLLQDSNAIATFVHAASFSAKETRTELLLAMVAGGARYVALPTVWKMGLVFQEVVRLGVADVFESDNSSTRDLQPIQTSLIWVSVGIWSGFRRKTEIASSFLQPIVTMLTWANALIRARYSDISPSVEDNDEVLYQKWRSWIREEPLKRVVLQTFLHDSQVATTHLRNRLVSPSQLLLPVPMSLDLWLAQNAQVWRNIWLSKVRPSQSQLPSVLELFANPGKLDELAGLIDKTIVSTRDMPRIRS
ncbi:hypothetical protein CBER1_00252 [Cercospora berteroae]|uniref:Xylanolytic transcriptional activator regulatory domain-containing protein n=1 Tax=Cercospora berteroae TaxID=357750 RepID=A0A2S6CDH9_9PEZI|nr:hypothetical protein CBER1_00252 [Cercospora berteroae]